MSFLDTFVRKIDTMREDLGAVGEIFDAAAHQCLVEGRPLAEARSTLDGAEAHKRRADFDADTSASDEDAELSTVAAALDHAPATLRDTLDAAMGLNFGRPRLTDPADDPEGLGRSTLDQPIPAAWADVVDEHLRQADRTGGRGALQRLAFDPATLVRDVGGKPVFRPRPDTALLHLAHPAMARGLTSLARLRFPGTQDAASCWTVATGELPEGADALLRLTVEELAVNELREAFHHWVQTFEFPVRGGELGDPLPLRPAAGLPPLDLAADRANEAADLWLDVEDDLAAWIAGHADRLGTVLTRQLSEDQKEATAAASDQYRSRQGEVSRLIAGNTMERLQKEIDGLRLEREQGQLFGAAAKLAEVEREITTKNEELRRRKQHYESVREQLDAERKRVLELLIPRRHAMQGAVQVHPVAVEIVL